MKFQAFRQDTISKSKEMLKIRFFSLNILIIFAGITREKNNTL